MRSKKLRSNGGVLPENQALTYQYWQVFKTLAGFDEKYLADDVFMPIIIRALNPLPYLKSFQHKGLFDIIYKELPKPKTYINVINGVWYDKDMKIITAGDTSCLKGRVIVKETVGTCCGKNVSLIDVDKDDNVDQILREYGDNWICQEAIEQSSKTACFCETSLNTFRISTVYLNGKASAETIMMRHGRNGAVVDNAGAGGICVGVSSNGKCSKVAYDSQYNKYKVSPTGVKYGEQVIPEVETLVKLAEESHRKYLPIMGFAGWDFALDKDNNPVFIEVNLGYPGILCEQLSTATPIFGNRTQEVLEYVKKNKSKIDWKHEFTAQAL